MIFSEITNYSEVLQMKDKYLKPEVEIEKFSMTEIMTASEIPGDDNDVPFGKENLFA